MLDPIRERDRAVHPGRRGSDSATEGGHRATCGWVWTRTAGPRDGRGLRVRYHRSESAALRCGRWVRDRPRVAAPSHLCLHARRTGARPSTHARKRRDLRRARRTRDARRRRRAPGASRRSRGVRSRRGGALVQRIRAAHRPRDSRRPASSRNRPTVTKAEAPVRPPREPRRLHRPAPGGVPPGRSSTNQAPRTWLQSSRRSLSETRRAGNRVRIGPDLELRCECAEPTCAERLPAAAEVHRKGADQFLVTPAHFDECTTVVRAADRFFVIESRERRHDG